jgi:ribosomal-protein-alanine N-acetyltransferase
MTDVSPILAADRILLRPIRVADLEIVWPHISDPRISEYMAWEAHTDTAQTISFLKAEEARLCEQRGATWAIFMDEAFCGIVSLIALVRSHRSLMFNKAELAYWLGVAHQGKGIATEAVARVMEYGFDALALHKIVVSHFGVNTASRKLIDRLGFRYIGTQRLEFQKAGIWHDHLLYELLEEDYREWSRRS